MNQQAPMIIAEEFREILTTLEKYGKVEYKTIADTFYIPSEGSMAIIIDVELYRPGEIYLLLEVGFQSTVTCLEMTALVDGNMYGYEPCYQPRLYQWGINFFKDGMIVTAKNYIWFTIKNPTSNPAYTTIRVGFIPISKDLFAKIEQKFFSVIKQVIGS